MPNVPITLPDGAANVDVLIDFTTVGSGANPHNAADYVGGVFPAGRITIPAGQTSGTIPYAFAPDNTVEPDETSTMSFSSPTAGVVISPGSVTLTGLNDDSAGTGPTIVYGPTTTMDTQDQQTSSRVHKVSTTWNDQKLIQLRVAVNGTTYYEMRQDSGTAVSFRKYTNGSAGTAIAFNNISAAPSNGATVSLEIRLKSGSTTEYQAYAVYGPYTQTLGLETDLTGTSARGQITYSGNNTGEPFTISKS